MAETVCSKTKNMSCMYHNADALLVDGSSPLVTQGYSAAYNLVLQKVKIDLLLLV